MKALILLHGALGSKAQLEPLKNLLSEHFAVHSFNLEGHGGLPDPERPFRIAHFVENLQGYMAREGLNKASFFGYSMGGYIALTFAAQQPEMVEGIYTLGTKLAWNPETAAGEVRMLNPEKMEAKIPAFANMLAQAHAPSDWKNVVRQTADLMLSLGENNLLTAEVFQRIETPVMLTVGDRDHMVSLEETIAAYRALPNGNLTVFPQTPHLLEKANLDLLAEQVVQFFKE